MANFKPQITNKKVDLDAVYPEYRKISEAPTLAEIEDEVCRYGFDLYNQIKAEQERLYKSQDKWGNVWLIQNPAVWKTIEVEGKTFKVRPKPKLASFKESEVPSIIAKSILMDDLI